MSDLPGPTPVCFGDTPSTVHDVRRVADGSPVALSPIAVDRILAGRAVVDEALAAGRPVYGLNTGVGHLKDARLPDDELHAAQVTLVRTHAGGLGEPEPRTVVRAAMAARLAGLARGGSGAGLPVAETLVAMLNAGVHPLVPRHGSVGAADLAQMAAIALVAIGEGRAELRSEILSGADALARAGIAPLVLRPKDGLALISANGVSIGHGALVVVHAVDLAASADIAAALALEAVRGNPSFLLPVVGDAKPYPGQIAALRSLRAALGGSRLLEPGAPASIQDPLSFRVVPQVHGALREYVSAARSAVEVELNSISDNPLVSLADSTLVHNGNFHPIVLAIAFDALRTAIAHVGLLSERRIDHLWTAFFERAGAVSGWSGTGSRETFGLWLRYSAASLVAELKQLAAPATLDVPPLDMQVEDHATGAPLAVRKTAMALDLLGSILTIEVLLARDVIAATDPPPALGAGTRAVLEAIDRALEDHQEDRSPAAVHALVETIVHRGCAC